MNKDILLADFDILMNYDYAVIKVIHDKYNNSDLTKDIDIYDFKEIYKLLENRTTRNPLSIIIKDEYKDSFDSILEELYQTEYDSIVSSLITNNNIFNVLQACNRNKMVEVTICCKNEVEEQIVKELFKYNTVLDENVDYNVYDTFMIHHKDRFLKNYQNYYGKSVYLAMTCYNLFYSEKDKCYLLPEEVVFVSLNKINITLVGLFNTKQEENKNE